MESPPFAPLAFWCTLMIVPSAAWQVMLASPRRDEDVFKVGILCSCLKYPFKNTALRPSSEPPKNAVP